MLEVNQQKLYRVKSLISKHSINPQTIIKIIHDEIMDMRKVYTLKEILEMINFEFEQEIKYANFQRILHRLNEPERKEEKEVKVTTEPIDSEQEQQFSIRHGDINMDDLI